MASPRPGEEEAKICFASDDMNESTRMYEAWPPKSSIGPSGSATFRWSLEVQVHTRRFCVSLHLTYVQVHTYIPRGRYTSEARKVMIHGTPGNPSLSIIDLGEQHQDSHFRTSMWKWMWARMNSGSFTVWSGGRRPPACAGAVSHPESGRRESADAPKSGIVKLEVGV